MDEALRNIELPLPLFREGKVRKVYELDNDRLLIVSTDRISAYDVVMLNGIPGKGRVLNTISSWFFKQTHYIGENHFITDDVSQYPSIVNDYRKILYGRSMIVKKTIPIPVECVVRADLLGSAWEEYKEKGSVCGIFLQGGLKKGDLLPSPIFTPAIKSPQGEHDINITFKELIEMVGKKLAQELGRRTIATYCYANLLATNRGIRISDTKYEFGIYRYTDIIQIDESHTPDSSRYIPDYSKQPVRDYLDSINYDRETPIVLPPEVVEATSKDYRKGCEIITGIKF